MYTPAKEAVSVHFDSYTISYINFEGSIIHCVRTTGPTSRRRMLGKTDELNCVSLGFLTELSLYSDLNDSKSEAFTAFLGKVFHTLMQVTSII